MSCPEPLPTPRYANVDIERESHDITRTHMGRGPVP